MDIYQILCICLLRVLEFDCCIGKDITCIMLDFVTIDTLSYVIFFVFFLITTILRMSFNLVHDYFLVSYEVVGIVCINNSITIITRVRCLN